MSNTVIQDDKKEIVLTEKLSDDLASLYMSENYSDVTFLVDDQKIPSTQLGRRLIWFVIEEASYHCRSQSNLSSPQ